MNREIYLKGGQTGILIIHGYSASALTFSPIAHALNQRGFTVYCILLPGHGTTIEALDNVTKEEYYECVRRKYEEFSRKVDMVFVFGQSLGSLLTINLAKDHELDGVILMSAPVLVPSHSLDRKDINRMTGIIGKFAKFPRLNPTYLVTTDFFEKHGMYSGFSARGIEVLCEVLRDARSNLSKLNAPVLVFQASYDPFVDSRTAEFIMGEIRSEKKKSVTIDSFGHRVFLGDKMPLVVNEICDFIDSVEKSGRDRDKDD
jgi:carboxylesterase